MLVIAMHESAFSTVKNSIYHRWQKLFSGRAKTLLSFLKPLLLNPPTTFPPFAIPFPSLTLFLLAPISPPLLLRISGP